MLTWPYWIDPATSPRGRRRMNQARVRRKRLMFSRPARSSGIPAALRRSQTELTHSMNAARSSAQRCGRARLSFALGVLQLAMSLDAGRKQQIVVVEALENGDGVRDRLDDHPGSRRSIPAGSLLPLSSTAFLKNTPDISHMSLVASCSMQPRRKLRTSPGRAPDR